MTERAEQIAEYAEIIMTKREGQDAQLGQPVLADGRKAGPQHQQSGDSQVARDLGVTRQEIQRAKTIAALPAEVKEAAREAGIDDNQSAMLRVAKAPDPVEAVRKEAEKALNRERDVQTRSSFDVDGAIAALLRPIHPRTRQEVLDLEEAGVRAWRLRCSEMLLRIQE